MLPDRPEVSLLLGESGVQNVGITLLGYKDYSDGGGEDEVGETPVATCFELKLLGLEGEAKDKCEDAVVGATKLKNIRVYTAISLCSANYSTIDGEPGYNPLNGISSSACANQ